MEEEAIVEQTEMEEVWTTVTYKKNRKKMIDKQDAFDEDTINSKPVAGVEEIINNDPVAGKEDSKPVAGDEETISTGDEETINNKPAAGVNKVNNEPVETINSNPVAADEETINNKPVAGEEETINSKPVADDEETDEETNNQVADDEETIINNKQETIDLNTRSCTGVVSDVKEKKTTKKKRNKSRRVKQDSKSDSDQRLEMLSRVFLTFLCVFLTFFFGKYL